MRGFGSLVWFETLLEAVTLQEAGWFVWFWFETLLEAVTLQEAGWFV